MELKKLTKSSMILAFPKIVNFFIKLLRGKLSAILIGTTGVGIVSQLNVIFSKLTNLSTLAMTIGNTKLIAEKKSDQKIDEIPSIIKTLVVLILPLTIIIYIAGFLFSDRITNLILGENELNRYFIIVFIAFPFLIFASVLRSILMGFKKIKYLSLNELLKIIISLIFFIPLIFFFKVDGVIINFALTIIIGFILLCYYTIKKTLNDVGISIKSIIKSKYSKNYAKELLTIGGIGITLGYYDIFSELFMRGILVNNVGISKIGIYAPIIAWSGLFTGFIYPAISQYIFPRLSETKNDQEVVYIINDLIRFLTFTILPFVLLGISFRSIIIPLFYSKDFIGAAIYLPLHFFGVLWFAWWYALMQIFTPTGRIKKWVPFGIILTTLTNALIFFGVPKFGLWAWAGKFSIIPIIAVISLFIYFKKEITFKLKKQNKIIIIYALISSLLITIVPLPKLVLYFTGPLLVAGIYFFIKENEKKYVYATVKKYINKHKTKKLY